MRVVLDVPATDTDSLRSLAASHGWQIRAERKPGRRRVADREGFATSFAEVRRLIALPKGRKGRLSQREAAARLGCSARTLARLLAAEEAGGGGDG